MANRPRHGTYYRESYAMKRAKRRARKKKMVIAIVCVLILVLAVAIGVFAYNKIVNDKLSLNGSNATQALSKTTDTTCSYTLIKIDAGKDESVSASYDTKERRELYFMMRTDTANSCISFIYFPTDLKVTLNDKKVHPLWQATNVGGDAELIRVLSDFCDVKINHFIAAEGDDLAKLVENIGGINVNLGTELDDPHAGCQTLKSGDVTLDSQSTKTLLRSRSVLGSNDTISKNLTSFASSLMTKMTTSGGFDLANVIDQFAEGAASDLKASDFTDFASKFANKQVTVYDTSVPGTSSKSTDTSETVFSARATETSQILEKFKSGEDPRDTNKLTTDFDKSQVHVEVRNGAGITGAASACKTFLESKGYALDGAGNVDDATTYEETLIVYLGDEYENAANAIVNELGCGRVVNGGDYYTSSSNIIVIIGLDWSATS